MVVTEQIAQVILASLQVHPVLAQLGQLCGVFLLERFGVLTLNLFAAVRVKLLHFPLLVLVPVHAAHLGRLHADGVEQQLEGFDVFRLDHHVAVLQGVTLVGHLERLDPVCQTTRQNPRQTFVVVAFGHLAETFQHTQAVRP